ncbi:MAG: RuBisCO large subunit C-terminal-like domain-containing protein [Thermoplasmatota archaeon]
MVTKAVVATYELEGDFPLEECARVVAMEQSTGTWTPVPKRTGSLEDRVAAWVEGVDEGRREARVAFPVEIFEPDNLPGLLSIVAGNLFGLGSLRTARLIDVTFPKGFGSYRGPAFGIPGVRRLTGTTQTGRPHGGTIVKPKVGLDPKGTAVVAKESALGGVDFIKDDETLTDQSFCPLVERGRLVMEALDEARSETGKPCLYAINVTAGAHEVLERWDQVRSVGANCVMIDVLTSGYDALALLRQHAGVPIHVHRAMHGAFTRSTHYGIDMRAIARLVRLCGGDQLHVGSAAGKMEHPANLGAILDVLKGPWEGFLPTFPVSSGGLHPKLVAPEVAAFGADVVIQAGGGIHGHPGGTRAGARALMRAIDAVHAGRPLEGEADPDLKEALRKWGNESYHYGT